MIDAVHSSDKVKIRLSYWLPARGLSEFAIGYSSLLGGINGKECENGLRTWIPDCMRKRPLCPAVQSSRGPPPRPVGTSENSPAFQRWVRGLRGISPEGTAGLCFLKRENHALCVEITHKLLRSLAFHGHFLMAPLVLKDC
jgi:hypothetical protein